MSINVTHDVSALWVIILMVLTITISGVNAALIMTWGYS